MYKYCFFNLSDSDFATCYIDFIDEDLGVKSIYENVYVRRRRKNGVRVYEIGSVGDKCLYFVVVRNLLFFKALKADAFRFFDSNKKRIPFVFLFREGDGVAWLRKDTIIMRYFLNGKLRRKTYNIKDLEEARHFLTYLYKKSKSTR